MTTKPKVSTLRGEKSRSIIKALKLYPEGTTPKNIAVHTRINVNTVKSILPKMPGVHRTMRGVYRVVNRGDGTPSSSGTPLTDWNFHNCILSTTLRYLPRNSVSQTLDLGILNFKFRIAQSGAVSASVGSETPLNVSSLSMAAYLLFKLLEGHCSAPPDWKGYQIRTIEFNKDHSNLRLDGIRCITVDSLLTQFKAYQKKIGLRVEHKTKVPFTAENIVQMLTSNPTQLETEVRLLQQSKELNRMKQALTTTNELLKQLIEVRAV